MEYIVTFHTHFDALQYDRFLRSLSVKSTLQPVPRALSSSCGTCVRFALDEGDSLPSAFMEQEFEKLVRIEGKNYVLIAEQE